MKRLYRQASSGPDIGPATTLVERRTKTFSIKWPRPAEAEHFTISSTFCQSDTQSRKRPPHQSLLYHLEENEAKKVDNVTVHFSGSSSPDDAGFISTAGNKGSSLSTPGTVRSTPSSEALDVVADLRYEALRFRSLPSHPPPPRSKETNGNVFSEEDEVGKPCQPPVVLNGNNAQHIEDLYAKVVYGAIFQ